MVGDIRQHRLIGDRVKAGHGGLAGRIDVQRPERPPLARRTVLGSKVSYRRVDGDRPGDTGPDHAGEPQRDQAAHAVSDYGGRGGDPGVGGDGEYLAGPCIEAVAVAPAAVAVPGKIRGDHPPAVRKQRANVVPPARVRGATVHEHQASARRVSPGPVGDSGSFDGRQPFLRRVGQRGGEPAGALAASASAGVVMTRSEPDGRARRATGIRLRRPGDVVAWPTMRRQDQMQEGNEVVEAIRNPR